MGIGDINVLVVQAADAWSAARDAGYRDQSLTEQAKLLQAKADAAVKQFYLDYPEVKEVFFSVASGLSTSA